MQITKTKDNMYIVSSDEGLLLYEHNELYGVTEYILAQQEFFTESEYDDIIQQVERIRNEHSSR